MGLGDHRENSCTTKAQPVLAPMELSEIAADSRFSRMHWV
jgi:hypothetical protein